MERISVDLGQFVVTGEPVAVMGGGAQSAVAKAGGASQPVLYVEFRKDGVPVDPGPWWAVNEGQKVRGMIMRKTSLILLGAAGGVAGAASATQPPIVFDGAPAQAAAADTYRQLSLF